MCDKKYNDQLILLWTKKRIVKKNVNEVKMKWSKQVLFVPFLFFCLRTDPFLFQWLNGVWSNFPGNILLTDDPNFNFNGQKENKRLVILLLSSHFPLPPFFIPYLEPIHVREPLDESLEFQVDEYKQQLRKLKEELFNTRKELTEEVTSFTKESLQDQSKEASKLTIMDTAPPKNEATKVDRDNTKQVETVYNEAVEILSHLEKTVPEQITKFKSILDLAK